MWTAFQDALFILALRRGILETLEFFSRENERINPISPAILGAAKAAIGSELLKQRPLEPPEVPDSEIIKTGSSHFVF